MGEHVPLDPPTMVLQAGAAINPSARWLAPTFQRAADGRAHLLALMPGSGAPDSLALGSASAIHNVSTLVS